MRVSRRCGAALFLCALAVPTAADTLADIETAARWAVEAGNAAALADVIARGRALGGSFAADDPYSLMGFLNALEGLDGGAALAADLRATASRGQLGGAPRQDFTLAAGEERALSVLLVPHERAFVEARLKRGSEAADIDLRVTGPEGALLAEDTGPETGIFGVGALVSHFPESCMPAIITVANTGTTAAEVALLVPLSPRQDCGG